MGVRDQGFGRRRASGSNEPSDEPIPVFIKRAPSARGLPGNSLLQLLIQQGIIRGQVDDQRGGYLEDFLQSFDISDVLSPIVRSARELNQGTGAQLFFDLDLTGAADRILVIRALTWTILEGGQVLLPDTLLVQLRGATMESATQPTFLETSGPFPVSDRVIGDLASTLTAEFNRLLPIVLLPGDILTFRQEIAPAAVLGSRLNWIEETYFAPFRPAGL